MLSQCNRVFVGAQEAERRSTAERELQQLPPALQEAAIVEDLILAFLGLDSKYVRAKHVPAAGRSPPQVSRQYGAALLLYAFLLHMPVFMLLYAILLQMVVFTAIDRLYCSITAYLLSGTASCLPHSGVTHSCRFEVLYDNVERCRWPLPWMSAWAARRRSWCSGCCRSGALQPTAQHATLPSLASPHVFTHAIPVGWH